MRLKILAAALICGLSSANFAQAQTLHLISIADSNDATIGPGTAANSKAIQSYASIVSVVSKLKLNPLEISGGQYSCHAISKAVQTLQVKPDDVIIFYYSGHGFAPANEASKSA